MQLEDGWSTQFRLSLDMSFSPTKCDGVPFGANPMRCSLLDFFDRIEISKWVHNAQGES